METLTKLLLIGLLIACLIIIMLQYNILKEAAEKELFEINYDESNFGSAGDIETIQQGDMNSVGAMSNIDGLDGTGTGQKSMYVQAPEGVPTENADKPGLSTVNTITIKNGDQEFIQADIHKGFTYYYLETDNINQPCKKHMDCPTMKCSESGFCKY